MNKQSPLSTEHETLMPDRRLYIGGAWVEGPSEFEVMNPAN